MLRLLLDEHLSPKIARQLLDRNPEMSVVSMHTWASGAYLETPDDQILRVAYEQGLTLVTFDQRTIPPILKEWAEQGTPHAGVIFADEHTLASSDIGGIVRALEQLWSAQGGLDWTDRITCLRRA